MVGFPGEGVDEFERTCALISALPFFYCHVFSFSMRPGTAAARQSTRIHPATVKSRAKILSEMSRRKRLAFYERYVGTTVQALFETRGEDGLWTGLTGNYVRVGVTGSDELSNRVRNVLITGVMDGLATGHLIHP